MYKKILVPVDGSSFSECIFDHVKTIATGCNVPEVTLLRVVEATRPDTILDFGASDVIENYRPSLRAEAEAKDYLDKVSASLKEDGVAAKTVLVSGMPAEEILSYANNNQVDLIIMSTHGRSGVTSWAFGSVADRVIRHSMVPVIIASPKGCRVS